MGEVDARDAFVVGRERHRHAQFAIGRERVVLAFDAENDLVAGEIDLHQHALVRHVLQEVVGAVLVHDVDAVADTVGPRLLHGEPHMAAKAFGRHQPRRQLARVQGHANPWIELPLEATMRICSA